MPQDTAIPTNPAPMAESDVYDAVRDFVLTYALPALAPDCVVQGWQNHAALPAGTNEYAVISILFDTPHGTPIEEFTANDPDPSVDGTLAVRSLVELRVQVDLCSEDDTARQRARRLATITESSVGAQFFAGRGMSALYADDVRDQTAVGDADVYVRRYMTTLHLSYWTGTSLSMPYFDTVTLPRADGVGQPPVGETGEARFEDVSVHHRSNG